MKHRFPRWSILITSALGLAACVNGALPSRSARHPGHPSAEEGYARVELGAISENAAPEERRLGPGARAASPGEGVIYTCPMHPEVVSSAPGTCPKCGMKLVPKPSPPKQSPTAAP